MRDYASIEGSRVPANIEGMNAELIHMRLSQGERLKRRKRNCHGRCRC